MPISSVSPTIVPTRLTPETSQPPTVIPYHVPGSDEDRIADTARVEPTLDGVDTKLADNPLLFDEGEFEIVRQVAELEDRIEGLAVRDAALDASITELTASSARQAAALADALAAAETARQAVPGPDAVLDGLAALTGAAGGTPSLNDQIAATAEEIAGLDARIEALDAGAGGAAGLRTDLVAQIAGLDDRLGALAGSLEGAEAKLRAAGDRLTAADAAIAAIDAGPASPEAAAQRAVLVEQRDAHAAEVAGLTRQVATIAGQMEALEAEVATLHTLIESLDADIAGTPERAALVAEREALVAQHATLGTTRAATLGEIVRPAADALLAARAEFETATAAAARAEAALAATTAQLTAAQAEKAAIPGQLDALSAELAALEAVAPDPDTSAVTLEDFLLAQTAHQLEFLAAVGGEVTFGAGEDAITFISSTDGTKVININALSVGAVSGLSKADQAKVAATDAWAAVADALGLIPNSTVSAAAAAGVASGVVAAVRDDIDLLTFGTEFEADRQVFLDELANMEARIAAGEIFDLDQIATQASEIKTRAERAAGFSVGVQDAVDNSGLDAQSLRQAYDAFIREENRILHADNRTLQLVRLAELGVPTLDLPQLIIELQTLFEDIANAEREILTEDTRQHNALLRDFAEMIARLGDTVSAINPAEAENRGFFVGLQTDRVGDMFTLPDRPLHPVEILNGLTDRPQFNRDIELRRDQWENIKNQLTDRVTTLNQNSQLRQNEINQKSSQANRHFEIVSDTIRRLFDLLQTIGRATA